MRGLKNATCVWRRVNGKLTADAIVGNKKFGVVGFVKDDSAMLVTVSELE